MLGLRIFYKMFLKNSELIVKGRMQLLLITTAAAPLTHSHRDVYIIEEV
jgi:hypothetical protein